MKQLIFALIFTFLGTSLSAQEGFKIGVQAGLPLGDYNDLVGVVIGADMGYMWAPNKIFDLGIKAGIIHGFAERFKEEVVTVKLPSIQFAPLAASVRIWPSRSFSLGGDIGQAFGLNEGNDGGLYYRPQIGFQTGAQSEFNFSYTAIQNGDDTWSTVTIGFVYTFLSARHFR
ncbi:outer membrane beta-barrel protein [uncultured Kriegella sp.]|uniref:outer membrane beta-barrel protein n=1 Tax=uncultured Kriegella sp. TaxID=1798910 RepID=UPI0030DB21A7|tara:strand:+ start:90653 stop:91168 length:516 start_codon:yes stop_codon:yes gene_type:complete